MKKGFKPDKVLEEAPCERPPGGQSVGTFTWSRLSSFFGLKKLLSCYLIPKKLLKKHHVNVPKVHKIVPLDQAPKGLVQFSPGLA